MFILILGLITGVGLLALNAKEFEIGDFNFSYRVLTLVCSFFIFVSVYVLMVYGVWGHLSSTVKAWSLLGLGVYAVGMFIYILAYAGVEAGAKGNKYSGQR